MRFQTLSVTCILNMYIFALFSNHADLYLSVDRTLAHHDGMLIEHTCPLEGNGGVSWQKCMMLFTNWSNVQATIKALQLPPYASRDRQGDYKTSSRLEAMPKFLSSFGFLSIVKHKMLTQFCCCNTIDPELCMAHGTFNHSSTPRAQISDTFR